MTLADIESIVKELGSGLEPGSDCYRIAVILLAGLEEGASTERVFQLTRYPRSFVRQVARRLRKNGVWVGSKTCADWFDEENGGVAFMCDVMVGAGIVDRAERDAST